MRDQDNGIIPVNRDDYLDAQPPSDNVSFCGKISRHIGSIICLIIVVVDWIAYAEIMQSFDHSSFNHLYFIRYSAVCGFMLAIIPWYFVHKHSMKSIKAQELVQIMCIHGVDDSVAGASYKSLPALSHAMLPHIHEQQTQHQSVFRFMYSMLQGTVVIAFASFFGGYAWYFSLDHTFVAVNTTIYQSQCVFVLLLSSLMLKTKITLMKLIACVIAICGVSLVSFGAKEGNDDEITATWYGYVLCFISMASYAIQTVTTKYYGNKYFRTSLQLADNFLLMFTMGLCVFLLAWPGFIILHFTGIEEFAFPKSYNDIMTVVLPVVLETIFTGSLMAGITLGGPILMSLGGLTTIPVSFVVDVWLHGLEVTMFAVIGSFLIFVSFILIEMPIHKIIPCIVQRSGNVQASDK